MKQVLIVDDSLEMGRWLQVALTQANPEIQARVVPSAEEALLDAGRRQIDLMVVDIRLPGMTGVELVRKVRARYPSMRVIFITGLSDARLRKQAEELKPDAFFTKPIEIPPFVEAVSASLNMNAAPPPAAEAEKAPPPEVVAKDSKPAPAAPPSELALPPVANLPAVLADLRGGLEALAVALLDDRGHVLAQTGDFPEASFESIWVPALMSAVSAGMKVSRLLGRPHAEGALVLRGATFDLLLAPVEDFTLVAAVRTGRSKLRLLLALEEVLAAQVTLGSILDSMRVPLVEPMEVPPQPVLPPIADVPIPPSEPEDTGLDKLKELFTRPTSPAVDADDFWEQASTQSAAANGGPDSLSYDQARQLGLAPEDQEK